MSTAPRKVLLVGWDAADWKIAAPLVDAGKMPTLERLIANGVMGNMATLYPVLSPMLWTSIATGKRAFKHGVHGFAEPDPRTGTVRPVTNLSRSCKAVWNILTQSGKRSNVVGWWPSHPAEPIDGVMVSNHFHQARGVEYGKPWPLQPGTIHPASKADQLADLRVHPAELDASQILPFVPKAASIDLEKDRRLSGAVKTLAEAVSIHTVATAIMQNEPWDFMAVYYDAIDHFSHGFMAYHPPRVPWVSEADFEIYKDVINGAYQFHDMMLSTLLHLAGPETTVILMSDHGFHSDEQRIPQSSNEPAGPADEHRQFGMFVMAGPGIRRDELVFGVNLLDVTPTILTLFGLPVGRDMDGRPLLSAFEQPPEVSYVDSWEQVAGHDGRHPPEMQFDAGDTRESLRQLAALGYIEKPDEDQDKALSQTVRELRHNLARAYMGAGRHYEAVPIFEALWAEFPDESRFGLKLVECHIALQQPAAAREALDRLTASKQHIAQVAAEELRAYRAGLGEVTKDDLTPEQRQKIRALTRRATMNAPTMAYLRGSVLLAEGRHAEAVAEFEQARSVQVQNRPSLLAKMGEAYLAQQRWDDAERVYREAVAIDTVSPEPHLGLAKVHLGRRRPKLALDEAMTGVGLVYANPVAHFLCGRALQALRRYDDALAAYRVAVAQNPVYPEAHRRIAALLKRAGDFTGAGEHARLARVAQARIANVRAGVPAPADVDLGFESELLQETEVGTVLRATADTPLTPDTVVVVSGLPRSGTSMMMQMLHAGGVPVLTDGRREADPNNPRGYYEFEPAIRLARDASWMAEAGGKAVKLVAQLLPSLPYRRDIRILFMQRPLGAVIASQDKMLKRLDRAGAKLTDRQLAATYRQQLALVRSTIERAGEGVSVLGVSYDEALREPAAVAAAVNRFLGGGLDEAAMTASVAPELKTVGV